MDNFKKGMPQIPATALSMMTDTATAPFKLPKLIHGYFSQTKRVSPERERAERFKERPERQRRMQEMMDFIGSIEAMPSMSIEIVRDDPFGVAANRAVKDLFGLTSDSMSKPTEFQEITGSLKEDF